MHSGFITHIKWYFLQNNYTKQELQFQFDFCSLKRIITQINTVRGLSAIVTWPQLPLFTRVTEADLKTLQQSGGHIEQSVLIDPTVCISYKGI